MYRTLMSLVLAGVAMLFVVGLTFNASQDAPPDLTIDNTTEIKTLDPQLATGQPEGQVIFGVFEGLTRYEAKTLTPAPGMAERWDISPDGTRYTFHLREGARWTDGHPVTAQDFVYAWKRLLTPELGSEYGYILYPVHLAEAFHAYAGYVDLLRGPIREQVAQWQRDKQPVSAESWRALLQKYQLHSVLKPSRDKTTKAVLLEERGRTLAELEQVQTGLAAIGKELGVLALEASEHLGVDRGFFAPDAHTFVVELDAPAPYFLQITSFYSTIPVPRWVVEEHPKDWFLPPRLVSNGPFVMEFWRVNERIRLRKNPEYWGRDEVRADVIDVVAVESATTALNMYLTGQTDWLSSNFPKELAPELKRRPDFYSNSALGVYYYRINTQKAPFNDRRVREALNLAIDRRVIVEEITGLGQLPAKTFVPPGVPGYVPPESGLELNVERARALMAEAGYPDGKGFPESGILYNTMEDHKKIAELIADQLRRNLGIDVGAYNQEWQSYQETVRAGNYTLARAAWIGDYIDPNTFLDMWVTNGGNNQTGFSSARYDKLIEAAANISEFLSSGESGLSLLKEQELARQLLPQTKDENLEVARDARNKLRFVILREAERILVAEEFPVIPIYFYVMSGFIKPGIRGFYSQLQLEDGTTAPNLRDIHPFRDLWFDPSLEVTP